MGLWGKKKPATDKPTWNQEDYHTEFAGKLTEQIRNGTAPWQKPWKPGERRLPENLHTGKAYRGGNSVYLSVTQEAKGYSDNRWATYKQITELDGQVRKGEQATQVLFYKFDDEQEQPQPGAPDQPARAPEDTAEKASTRPPLVRCYAVFNVEQADGLTLERRDDDRDTVPEWEAHHTAERVIQESGVRVNHERGDRAVYNLQPTTPRCCRPRRARLGPASIVLAAAKPFFLRRRYNRAVPNYRRRTVMEQRADTKDDTRHQFTVPDTCASARLISCLALVLLTMVMWRPSCRTQTTNVWSDWPSGNGTTSSSGSASPRYRRITEAKISCQTTWLVSDVIHHRFFHQRCTRHLRSAQFH